MWLVLQWAGPMRTSHDFGTWASCEVWKLQARMNFVLILATWRKQRHFLILADYVSPLRVWHINMAVLHCVRCSLPLNLSSHRCKKFHTNYCNSNALTWGENQLFWSVTCRTNAWPCLQPGYFQIKVVWKTVISTVLLFDSFFFFSSSVGWFNWTQV